MNDDFYPLPWQGVAGPDGDEVIAAANGNVVAAYSYADKVIGLPVEAGNVDRIIKAVNAHPKILEALKELVRLAEGDDHEAYHAAFVVAKGTIALAEGRIR